MNITSGTARAFTIPTDAPEADGTIAWDSTTLVVVTLVAGGVEGIGYTYAHATAATVARELIEKHCIGANAFATNKLFSAMRISQRNYGREGIAACALSAVDIALWDLKAKLVNQPLVRLLGVMRDAAPVYGSGGFTTYTGAQLRAQLAGWVEQGIPRVKMKIGTQPERDPHRVAVARDAIGPHAQLFIDANGAFEPKQACAFAKRYREEQDVVWFEEPVTSDDLPGLRFVREHGPAGMDIAAGAVDVVQADATRCGGVTGFMDAAALADAHPVPLSAHCGPTIHMHLACAARPLRHVEYFHDHVRIESMFFDGFIAAANDGCMHPDFTRAGLGITLKTRDAERYAVKD